MTEDTTRERSYRYNGLAIYALILGVLSPLWILFGFPWVIFGILAIFAGLRARREIDSAPDEMEGRTLTTVAIIAGAFGLGSALLILAVLFMTPPA